MASSQQRDAPESKEFTQPRKVIRLNTILELPVCLCDKCNAEIRFGTASHRCTECDDYDLCQECFNRGHHCLNATHTFKAETFIDYMRRPTARKRYLDFFYQRHPIDETRKHSRILHVHEADSYDAPLEGCLSVESWTEWPRYHALSYCWGVLDATKVMTISSWPIAITENLEAALKRIRSMKGDVRIWVDQICVNQSNHTEQASQVRLMGSIYEQAWCVYVYLGEHSSETLSKPPFSRGREAKVLEELAMEGFSSDIDPVERQNLFADIIHRPWFSRTWVIQEATLKLGVQMICGSLVFQLDDLLRKIGEGNLGREWTPWAGMMADVSHPSLFTLHLIQKLKLSWFSRHTRRFLTTLKETAPPVPERVEGIDIEELSGAPWDVIKKFEEGIKSCESKLADAVSIPYTMLDLLCDFRRQNAADPRDKVYATIGLASDASDAPEISYDDSTDVVYQKFAAYLVSKGHGPRVLHSAASHPQTLKLPSWVPDWSSQKCSRQPLDSFLEGKVSAGGKAPGMIHVSTEGLSLEMSGCVADRVAYTGPALHHDLMTTANMAMANMIFADLVGAPDEDGKIWSVRDGLKRNGLDKMRKSGQACWYPKWLVWLSAIIIAKKLLHTGVVPEKDVLALISKYSNHGHDTASETSGPETGLAGARGWDRIEDIFFHAVDADAMLPPPPEVEEEFSPSHDLNRPRPELGQDPDYFLLNERVLCITDAGRLGLVPGNAKKGDEILVLPGAVTPFIVRKSGSTRTLVGDCYIRGLMSGEGLLQEKMELIVIY